MEVSVGVAAAIAIAKHAVPKLFEAFGGDSKGFEAAVAGECVGKLEGPLKAYVDALKPNLRLRAELQRNGLTFSELAAVGWGQLIKEADDTVLSGAAEASAEIARLKLGLDWFLGLALTQRVELKGSVAHQDWEESLQEIAGGLAQCAAADLGIEEGPSEALKQLILELTEMLPARVEQIYMVVPENQRKRMLEKLSGLEGGAEEILHIVSGEASLERAAVKLQAYLQKLAAGRTRDAFGREEFQEGELPKLPLGEVYVEPTIKGSDSTGPLLKALDEQWERAPGSLAVVVAPFGFGKSLSMRMWAARCADRRLSKEDRGPIPLFLDAPLVLRGRVERIESALLHVLESDVGLDTDDARLALERLEFSVILDSFDELEQSEEASKQWLEELEQTCQKSKRRCLVAGRPWAVRREWLSESSEVLEIKPFDEDQVQLWVARHKSILGVHELSTQNLSRWLARDSQGTPILLLMAAWVSTDGTLTEETSRTALYTMFTKKISCGKWEGVQRAHPVIGRNADQLIAITGSSFEEALGIAAWCHLSHEQKMEEFGEKEAGLPISELKEAYRNEFRDVRGGSLPEKHINELLQSIVLSLFMGVGSKPNSIRFTHKSFREFLCARYLLSTLLKSNPSDSTSPGRLALMEVVVDVPEAIFFEGLFHALSNNGQQRVLSALDHAYRESRPVIVGRSSGDISIHTLDHRSEMVVFAQSARQLCLVRSRKNAEMLAGVCRKYENIISIILGPHYSVRLPSISLSGDMHRLLETHPFGGLAYETLTGHIYLVVKNLSSPPVDAALEGGVICEGYHAFYMWRHLPKPSLVEHIAQDPTPLKLIYIFGLDIRAVGTPTLRVLLELGNRLHLLSQDGWVLTWLWAVYLDNLGWRFPYLERSNGVRWRESGLNDWLWLFSQCFFRNTNFARCSPLLDNKQGRRVFCELAKASVGSRNKSSMSLDEWGNFLDDLDHLLTLIEQHDFSAEALDAT